MSSAAETLLKALQQRLAKAAPCLRNAALPLRIPDEGLLIIRDGAPDLEENVLGSFSECYYRHAIDIEIFVQGMDASHRDHAFDILLERIGGILETDPTLGGLVFGLHYERPSVETERVEGAAAIKQGILIITVEYMTHAPLG
jgi:hypothetical protein